LATAENLNGMLAEMRAHIVASGEPPSQQRLRKEGLKMIAFSGTIKYVAASCVLSIFPLSAGSRMICSALLL
jgi:hypothetical protein